MTAPLTPEELDLLADLLAGEGTEEQIDRVASSPALSQALADLDAAEVLVRAGLASVAALDVTPPDGFDERLRAALAAAGAPADRADAGADADAAPRAAATPGSDPSETVVPLSARRAEHESARHASSRPARSPWPLRIAAGVIGVGLLAGVGALTLSGGGGSDDSAETAAAAPSAPTVPTSSSGTDYQVAGTLQAALPSLLAGAARQRLSSTPADTFSGGTASTPSSSAARPQSDSSGATAEAADPLDRLRDPAALQACYTALELPAGSTPVALDYARYAGQPALVVVLPVAARADKVEAYVVGASCGAGTDDLLFFGRLDRP